MNQFIISEEQANTILNVLAEVPAKLSFSAIVILKQLPTLTDEYFVPNSTTIKPETN